MAKLVNLLLLYGGKSGEHDISLISAASVLANLDPARFNITPVGIGKDGCFYVNDYKELIHFPDVLPVMTPQSRRLDSLLLNGALAVDADIVFPVMHGPLYEDGCLQGLLELARVAYVGCDVLSSAIAMDKDMARRIACTDDIQSTPYRLLSWHASNEDTQQFCQTVVAELGWPLFVKPCSMGSSVGIHKVSTMDELVFAISDARRFDKAILVEAYVAGREIELAVLESNSPNKKPHVSIPGEIEVHHPDGFYSYTAKYLESVQTTLQIPAKLEEGVIRRLQQAAGDIFTSLKCKGLARVDFFVDEHSRIYFNEINTMPGFTSISMYPKLWQSSGIDYPDLLNRLIDLAMMHQRCREQMVTNYS